MQQAFVSCLYSCSKSLDIHDVFTVLRGHCSCATFPFQGKTKNGIFIVSNRNLNINCIFAIPKRNLNIHYNEPMH